MSELEDYDFASGDAGSSTTYNQEAGQIRVGGYMCIKGRPCKVNCIFFFLRCKIVIFCITLLKVSAVSTSKTGKHGHAKCNFTAIDIFNGKKYEDIIPSTHTALVPFVTRKDYTLVDIGADGFCSLMDEKGDVREDVKLPDFPDGFDREIKGKFEDGKSLIVGVLTAMNHDQIVAVKEDTA
jgi:translation initiation factor 5A